MAVLDTLCYWTSLIIGGCLAHYFSVSVAYDWPLHTVILAFGACSFLLLSASKALPDLFSPPVFKDTAYTAVPLDDLTSVTPRLHERSSHPGTTFHNGRVRISVLCASVCTLSVRLELYRRISEASECTINSVEVYLPLLLAIYDAARFQRPVNFESEEKPDQNVYESMSVALRRYILRPRTRLLLPAFLLSYGSYLVLGLWTSSNSTYICPVVVGDARTIPLMQICALFLDWCLAVLVYEMSPRSDGSGLSGRRMAILWSSTMIGVVAVWSFVALMVYIFKPEHRSWLLLLDSPTIFGVLAAMIGQAFIFSLLCITSLHFTLKYGALELSMALTSVMTMIPGFAFIWSHKNPFPPTTSRATTWSFLLIYIGWWSFRRIRGAMGDGEPARLSRQVVTLVLLAALLFPAWLKKGYAHFHPIDLLIYDARIQHEKYLETVSWSQNATLADTVGRYRQRYDRNPPPGFDIWFEFAKNKSALIMDEYDQIYKDLLPFRTIPPAELRRQTWQMVSNPWNEISGISIRDGNATVQENVLPTHRWMLEGVAALINSFARYLPDMDLAFNLNDESRVAVNHHHITSLREHGRIQDASGSIGWSANRAAGWLPPSEHELTDTVFRDHSFRNTFQKFGAVGCDPNSAARRYPHISSRSHLCGSCTGPHSIGQFISNWSQAADICHQPDLRHLHGFYLSPAAFKTSSDLMPVFSQSKPHGYNDILYPSAWNYRDKVVYAPTEERGTPGQDDYHPGFPDPPFQDKRNVLFWRGSTSEGVSSGDHVWRGMVRQRLVHMVNNATASAHDQVTILLPNPAQYDKYKYQVLPGPAVKELGLITDISIVDHIARCGMQDCTDQEHEFGLVQPSDFQFHWQNRFLFDLDGAGFSGRFLPFLQSHSLPFKTALFREWYDSRLTAWRHFVPQDIRLHGIWSTLAYFAGINGTMHGQRIWWRPHLKEGEMIAEEGRQWANRVLRKEDMEIYFFRLLLEWARLTDDNRDDLGFVVD